MKFNHIGFVVKSIDESVKFYTESLNMIAVSKIIYDPLQKVRLLFLKDSQTEQIVYELIEPAQEDAPSYQWLKRGNSLHHICYEVGDIRKKIDEFISDGNFLISGPMPAIAFNNRNIAFILTKEKLIVELLEEDKTII